MKSQSLNQLLKDSINSLNYSVAYKHGHEDDFGNEFETIDYPVFWTTPFVKTTAEFINDYITLDTQRVDFFLFYKDKSDNRIADREAIEFTCDEVITELVTKINGIDGGIESITINSLQYSFVKLRKSSILMGIVGSFLIVSPNDFDYCGANS